MRRHETIVGLSPSAVEVGQFRGGECLAYDRTPTAPSGWPESWSKQLRSVDAALAQSCRKLGIGSSHPVDVVYTGPDTLVEVIGIKVSGDDAVRAARLALSEAMPGGIDGRPHHLKVLAADAAGPERRTHVLAAAERDESAQAIAAWVRRAGLRVGRLIPAGALAMTAAVDRVMKAGAQETVSLLLVSEHRTVIAAASAGSLRCVRCVSLGFDALAEAVVRAAAGKAEGQPLPDYEAALHAVLSVGIPRREQRIGIGDLAGESVLPYLQPVLQRFVVEIKQTLRFGLGESELARSSMLLSGPGGAIPQLAQLLSSQIDIPVTVDAGTGVARLVSPASDLTVAANLDRSEYSFLPHVEVTSRERAQRKRFLVAGAGVAGLLLAGDALLAMNATRQVNRGMTELLPELEAARADTALRASAAAFGARVGAEEQAIRDALGERPDWGALFDQISQLSGPPIRLLEISVTQTLDGYAASIRGLSYVDEKGEGESTDSLGSYIATLQGSALIRSVELGSTRLGEVDGRPVKYFLVTAKLTGLPVSFADWEARP